MPRILGRDSATDHTPLVLPGPGAVLDRRFELVELIGAGGMGAVYRARDLRDGATIALKLLTADGTHDVRRFRREFRAGSRLDHPNVVTTLAYHASERPFFTMEFVPGATLDAWVGPIDDPARDRAERFRRLRAAFGQILNALDYIHGRGLVHRDLKPENILVTASGQIKVMDFGLARGGSSSSGSAAGATVGTLRYMAPEQLEGRAIDHRADLYSVGAILYEQLTGEPPFDDARLGRLARAILHEVAPAPRLLEPTADPALADLATTLLAKQPWQRFACARDALAAMELAGARPGVARPTLVRPQFAGREAELRTLRQALASLGQGQPALVQFMGAPGTGKSRLLEESAALAHRAGFRVCELAAAGGPFGSVRPVIDLLRRDLRAADAAADDEGWLAALDGLGAPDERRAERVGPGRRAFVRALARSSADGLVLLIDDLHRSDAESRELLAAVVRQMGTPVLNGEPTPRVLIIATVAKPAPFCGGTERRLLELGLELRVAEACDLAPLVAVETTAVARSMLGEGCLPSALGAWLQAETSGNPWLIEQTLRHVVDEGLLVRDGGRLTLNWSKLGRPPQDTLEAEDFRCLPAAKGARALLERQLARPRASARSVLAVAAAIGHEFDFDLVLAASGLAEEILIDDLQALTTGGVVVELDDRPDTYRFVYPRVQELLLADLTPERRLQTHAAVAQAMERGPAAERDPIALARHWDAAGARDEAIVYLPLAAARLSDATDHAAACEAWERYLELASPVGAAGRHARRMLARELSLVRRLAEARAVLLALVAETADASERGGLLNELSLIESRLGDFSSAGAHACEQLALARGSGDLVAQAEALTAQGSAHTNQGYFADAERCLREAESLLEAGGAPDRLAAVVRNRAAVIAQQGRLVEAAQLVQRALAQARLLGDRAAEQFCFLELGNVHLMKGAVDRALDCYAEALAVAEELGHAHRIAYAQTNFAGALIAAGDYLGAESLLARCLRFRPPGLHAGVECDAYLNRAMARRAAGDVEAARSDLARARAALGVAPPAPLLVQHALALADTEAELGRPQAARRAAREALAVAVSARLPWYEARARSALAGTLRGAAATREAARAVELAQEMGAELVRAEALAREATAAARQGEEVRAGTARAAAARILRALGRTLGARERGFLRTPLCRAVLGDRA